jgi:hypothetical protein
MRLAGEYQALLPAAAARQPLGPRFKNYFKAALPGLLVGGVGAAASIGLGAAIGGLRAGPTMPAKTEFTTEPKTIFSGPTETKRVKFEDDKRLHYDDLPYIRYNRPSATTTRWWDD